MIICTEKSIQIWCVIHLKTFNTNINKSLQMMRLSWKRSQCERMNTLAQTQLSAHLHTSVCPSLTPTTSTNTVTTERWCTFTYKQTLCSEATTSSNTELYWMGFVARNACTPPTASLWFERRRKQTCAAFCTFFSCDSSKPMTLGKFNSNNFWTIVFVSNKYK